MLTQKEAQIIVKGMEFKQITPEPGRVLVTDDNKMMRLLLTRSLEQQGHSVASAENGRDALEMLRNQPFDLMLLDIEMPVMNGFEVLEVLFNDPILRNIPVIMVSASEEADSAIKCIEMGAEDYLQKPPNAVLLRARVSASLEKKRLRDQQRKLFQTFATSEVADELLSKGFSLGGKHVEASAMFTDIRNFTPLAESRDPEETINLLNSFYALMFSSIQHHGGMVNQIQGDGLLAIFGVPVYYEDHRERAVRAGQEMLTKLALFNQEQARHGKPRIQIGIGVASGQMVAGYAGTQDRATFTCIGDTVNLAARLETHTKIVQKAFLIDSNTARGLPKDIDVRALGPILFKGKTHEVETYAVETDTAS